MNTPETHKLEAAQDLELLKRGTQEIISEAELLEKIIQSKKENRPLIIKLGLDPTAPDIHLGFAVVLRKLRQFQDLGHLVIVIIGDFTARVGDPSGRSETRPVLSAEAIEANARTYKEQLSKILDLEKTRIVFNSQWFAPMNFADILELTQKYTVARLLERDDFAKRFQGGKPIGLHELLYPIMQGYDSVQLKADVELGGTDQKFNLLVGRDLQREYGQAPQVTMTMPILEGLDGKMKMSKSLKNYVGISEPPKEMFGKLMSIPDELMEKYFILATSVPLDEVKSKIESLMSGALHPRELKKALARAIIGIYHGEASALEAEAEFEKIFHNREIPAEMPEFTLEAEDLSSGKIWIVKLLNLTGLAESKKEAGRLIAQGAVSLNGEKVNSPDLDLPLQNDAVLKVGSRKFLRLKLPA